MKPQVLCHMMSSLDGKLAPSRWSRSPDGSRGDWSAVYAEVHDALDGDAWMVGRVTMAEMAKAGPHAPANGGVAVRPIHVARTEANIYAVALDPSGKVHFDGADLEGDHLVVLLGRDVADRHLNELAADGISYIVADTAEIDLSAMLDLLGSAFGIRRLLIEGGAGIVGAFLGAGLVDELSMLVVPALDGRPDARAVIVGDEDGLADKVALAFVSATPLRAGAVQLRYTVGAAMTA